MQLAAMPRRRAGAHDPAGRRADVLAAARRLFAAHGFAQTSIRAIAAEANVNQALVITYFGNKERLFLEVVGRFTIGEDILSDGPDGLGARLARLYVDRWENMPPDDPWPALVRSAASHAESRQLLQSELRAQKVLPLAQVLGDTDEARIRNAMVQCLVGGMIMQRYIFQLEPACSIPADAFEAGLAACLQHAISGPLGSIEPESSNRSIA